MLLKSLWAHSSVTNKVVELVLKLNNQPSRMLTLSELWPQSGSLSTETRSKLMRPWVRLRKSAMNNKWPRIKLKRVRNLLLQRIMQLRKKTQKKKKLTTNLQAPNALPLSNLNPLRRVLNQKIRRLLPRERRQPPQQKAKPLQRLHPKQKLQGKRLLQRSKPKLLKLPMLKLKNKFNWLSRFNPSLSNQKWTEHRRQLTFSIVNAVKLTIL